MTNALQNRIREEWAEQEKQEEERKKVEAEKKARQVTIPLLLPPPCIGG